MAGKSFQKLSWSASDIIRELGLPKSTVYDSLSRVGLAHDGLTTRQVVELFYGNRKDSKAIAKEREKLLIAQTKLTELRAAEQTMINEQLTGSLVSKEEALKEVSSIAYAVKTIIMHSGLSARDKADLLTELSRLGKGVQEASKRTQEAVRGSRGIKSGKESAEPQEPQEELDAR